jgi:hypothetical protein
MCSRRGFSIPELLAATSLAARLTRGSAASRRSDDARASASAGFTYLEVLVAGLLLVFALFSMSTMFIAGYASVTHAGRTTMGLAASRQLLEDLRLLRAEALLELDGFVTDNPATLPDANPAREVARRFRYALAGEGVGFEFGADEVARWPDLAAQGGPLGAVGRIAVTPRSTTLTEVRLLVSVPGHVRDIEISTLVTSELEE